MSKVGNAFLSVGLTCWFCQKTLTMLNRRDDFESSVRESPDELTLLAEEMGTWKSHINVRPHGKGEVGVLSW